MLTQIRITSIPADLQYKLKIGYKLVLTSLGIMFVGMFIASFWQWVFDIKSTTLMQSPILIQAMMVGGFVAFLFSLFLTFLGIPIWYEIQKRFLR